MSTDLHELTGVYAGGALPAQEQALLEEHLRSCPRCARETLELLETAALLGVAAAAAPPPHLRARVLAQAAATAQLPPLLSTRRANAATSGAPLRRWPLRAAACLAALALGVTAYTGLPGLDPPSADQRQAQQSGPRTLTATTDATSATVTLDATAARMSFTASGLRALGPGRTYQLWLLEAAGPRPAGTFTLTPSGEARVILDGPGRATTLLVTEEPVGGSAQPTTQPVLAVDLRQA